MSIFTLEPEKESSGGFPLLSDGSKHPAKVINAGVKTITPKKGDPFDKVEFEFELQGPEYSFISHTTGDTLQRRIYGQTSTVFNDSPYCKLRAWVTEIFAEDNSLPEGFSFDLDDLVGNECIVIVEVNEWDDYKAPESTWALDALTNTKVPPKKSNNRVTDVVRADESLSGPSVSKKDEIEEPF